MELNVVSLKSSVMNGEQLGAQQNIKKEFDKT